MKAVSRIQTFTLKSRVTLKKIQADPSHVNSTTSDLILQNFVKNIVFGMLSLFPNVNILYFEVCFKKKINFFYNRSAILTLTLLKQALITVNFLT
jgi:hypothetical protein